VRRFHAIVGNRTNNDKRHLLIVEERTDIMEEVPTPFLRALPDLIVLCLVAAAQSVGALWLLRGFGANWPHRAKSCVIRGTVSSIALLVCAFLLRFVRIAKHLPIWLPSWGRGLVIAWALLSMLWITALVAAHFLSRTVTRTGKPLSVPRRTFLNTIHTALFAVPPVVVGYGTFIQRRQVQLREERIVSPNLPADLDGIRIVQLTDIHRGPFLSRQQLDWAVQIANETRAHFAIVTGDLISSGLDPLDDCLDSLARLRADAGVFGCLGNHEIYAGAVKYTEREAASRGIRFLRHAAEPLRFGNAKLNLAGVDYQMFRRPYLKGAEHLIAPDAYNVLLSHNPDVFPIAAKQGYDLTISGHTHGGQIRVEILTADLNVARMFTPYVDGVYRQGKSSAFVSRGLGTIGLPTRLGAPPEVALLHLCRT
jgi:uncharacterized protein